MSDGNSGRELREPGPPKSMVAGLIVFMLALAAFLAWMLSSGGETDAQRSLRELDLRASPQPRGDPPVPASLGQVIFERQCATCHGMRGQGGSNGPNLTTKRYTPPRWEDQDLANVIFGGKGSMPGFSTQLTVEELGSVVAYIRWEQGLPVPGAAGAPGAQSPA